jgi:glycosyltransferase involved in cell wall biosynthesis/tetratricopeptide (TPR) repeat protein
LEGITLAAVITARDAEPILPDLLESIKDQVDEIVVGVDDRTVDRTREVAAQFGARVFDVSLVRDGVMDFAQGRNQTLEKAALTTDFFVWLDTDDVVVGNVPLKTIIADAIAARPEVESIWLPYIYSRDQYGKPLIRQYRERIIRVSANPAWKARLHETCHTTGGPKQIWAEANLDYDKARVYVDHKNRNLTEAGKWDRNFPILMKMVEEDPNDYRAVREVAEAYFAATQWADSIEWYDRYLDLTQNDTGTPLEERWLAVIYKAKAQRMTGNVRESMRTADRAHLMCPQYADSYFELMYGYVLEGHWPKAIYWFEEGLKRGRPDGIFGTSPFDYEGAPYRAIHTAFYESGDLAKAIECVDQAMKFLPDDADLQHAWRGYTNQWQRKVAVDSALQVVRHLIDANEPLKAEAVMASLPAGASEDFPEVGPMRAEVNARLAHMRDARNYRAFYEAEKNEVDPVPDVLAGKTYGRMVWLVDRLKANKVKSVLSIGVGSGFDALLFAHNGIRTVAIDVDHWRVKDGNFAAVRAGFMGLMDAPEHTEVKEEHEHVLWEAGCEKCGPVLQIPDMNPESMVQFHVGDAERISQKIRDLGPFDAVVMAELLEHVRDVDKVIEQAETIAPLVIITTPDGTAPQTPYPSHVRSWSQKELESLFWKRGQLIESHYLIHDPDQLAIEYRPAVDVSERMPIVIFCGPGLEKWSPEQIDRDGLGGSETAVVYVAKELVAQGFRVMVYAEAEGIWDGVYYRHHSKFVPENPIGLFIAWRNPTLIDLPIAAEKKFLWLHDVDSGDHLTPERAAKFDGLLILSEWHQGHLSEKYPFIPDEKYVIIGNGIDPDRFAIYSDSAIDSARDVNRFVYVSSPDRGLERALVFWPFIRKAYPEATLHVYYGWENYDRLGRDPSFKNWILDRAKQDGVSWYGRIGQRQLARELMKSGGLFYPGPHPFEETFCISALEAQAAGCVPVTRDNGALPEVNSLGYTLDTLYATVNDYTAALADSSQWTDEQREAMAAWAKTQTWGRVVERFLNYARSLFKEEAPTEEAVAV